MPLQVPHTRGYYTIYPVTKKLIFTEASKKRDLNACEPQHIRGTSHMAQIKTSPRMKRKLC